MWTEAQVEKHLHKLITEAGGTTRKWTSPGRVGVPDRIVFINDKVYFVEVKTMRGSLTVRQQREAETLRSHGALVQCLYGEKDVEQFVESVS